MLFIVVISSKDTLREDRATGDPLEADKSNFLHPVLYYYRSPPSPGRLGDHLNSAN